MTNYDLSILIPARNEIFLAKTVENLLKSIRGNTEIIIVLDGQWANPPVVNNERVTIIYNNTSVGQRAATNQAAKISNAKYVMKLDAHCQLDEGFDVKLIEALKGHDNWTIVPLMRNLHAFDWICDTCGNRRYQSPTPTVCNNENCPKRNNSTFTRDVVWIAKESPRSTSFCFDKDLHFQYFAEFKRRSEGNGDITDTMSIQGSCFMLTREKYWELNICDEEFGSWGQQGVEVACKTWLSGGEVKCLQTTWYAHMFRTQGGDFSFPYKQSQKQIDHARVYSRQLFQQNKWSQAVHTFEWLLKKFYPVPYWDYDPKKEKEPKRNGDVTKGIIFYTDNTLSVKLAKAVQKQIEKSKLPIVSASLKPMDFGKNVHVPGERGYLQMAKQILAALEASTADVIYFTEHDVLYHPSHFRFIPSKKDVYYYNTNVWRIRKEDGFALWTDDLQQLSGLVAYREILLKHYRERVKRLEQNNESSYVRAMGFEPGTHGRPERVDDLKAENYQAEFPNLDIRHETNLTPSRWKKEQFRNPRYIKGWKEAKVWEVSGWSIEYILKTLSLVASA